MPHYVLSGVGLQFAYNFLSATGLNIGTPKTIHFPFGTNGKLMVLGVPILKHFRVVRYSNKINGVK